MDHIALRRVGFHRLGRPLTSKHRRIAAGRVGVEFQTSKHRAAAGRSEAWCGPAAVGDCAL